MDNYKLQYINFLILISLLYLSNLIKIDITCFVVLLCKRKVLPLQNFTICSLNKIMPPCCLLLRSKQKQISEIKRLLRIIINISQFIFCSTQKFHVCIISTSLKYSINFHCYRTEEYI